MKTQYDFSRKTKLEAERDKLQIELDSVQHNIALEDSKAEAFNDFVRIAEKFPYVYVKKIDDRFKEPYAPLPPGSTYHGYYTIDEYLFKSRLVRCDEVDSSSNIHIVGVVFHTYRSYTTDGTPMRSKYLYYKDDDAFGVSLWCGEVDYKYRKQEIVGMDLETARKFIVCLVEAEFKPKLEQKINDATSILE